MHIKRLISIAIAAIATSIASAEDQKVIVYPLEAIIDSASLPHREFQEKHTGIDVGKFGLTDEGWYIRYTHKGLTYLFGPSDDLDAARQLKALLEQVRLSVVLKKPQLSSSAIDIVRYDFSDAVLHP